MKTNPSILITTSCLATLLVCASCSSDKSSGKGGTSTGYQQSSTTNYQKGVPGGVIVDTFQITATVAAVDHDKRQYTLMTPDGRKTQYTAGPEVVNFDQVRVGDKVKATVTEQLAVSMREKGEPRSDGQTTQVAVAPKGAKPGVVMVDTVEVTARVKSVDLKNHKATLEFPDGRTRTVSVRPDVKLSDTDVGREVMLQTTEAVALKVEKP
ncbi:MAG TPA: hypothetical protein VK615_02745 [Candidatus Binatia bacterium]|nr:hypothetical protein [Candidatus Binatia bacterium]